MNLIVFHITRLFKATGYSMQGISAALKTEPAFVLEVLLCFFLVPTAVWLQVPLFTKAILISSLFLVLLVELLNSAVEAVVDRISTERHPLSKKAKDVGSAAVLLSILNAIILWVFALI
ncbi:MAG: diacylglycerol kinase [Candidatus Berkiella sp.]